MSPEALFFKYAFPCSNVLVEMGAITKERFDDLKKDFDTNLVPKRQILEDSFKAAFRRIKILASEMNIADYWDFRVIQKYWRGGNHNKNIDDGDGNYAKFPSAFNDFCKVHKARVISIINNMLIISYDDKKRPVFNTLVPHAKIGDVVLIHHAYAIEVV